MKNDRVNALLQDWNLVNEDNHALVQAVRQMVLNVGKEVSEEVKYGGILFSGTQAFCGVFAYAKHISLEFGEGARLADPFAVLEGKGKFRRHIKLTTIADIDSKHLLHYVKLAYQQSLTEKNN